MTTWSIEAELCGLAESPSLREACESLRLTEPLEVGTKVALAELAPWQRSGAETYLYLFAVKSDEDVVGEYALKAMVAATPGIPPELQLSRRLNRRQRLVESGGTVPNLYAAKKGVWLEERLPHSLLDALDDREPTHELQRNIISLLASVAKAGFSPLSVAPNIMVRNATAYWVDFGTDLGDPISTRVTRSDLLHTLLAEAKNASGSTVASMALIRNALLGDAPVGSRAH
jgi:hypothetical protein